MPFVQIIEYTTSRHDEIDRLMDDWEAATSGRRTAVRGVHCADRDTRNAYVSIVEFESYDKAMENSSLTETSQFEEQFAKLCDGVPIFRNLDVRRSFDR